MLAFGTFFTANLKFGRFGLTNTLSGFLMFRLVDISFSVVSSAVPVKAKNGVPVEETKFRKQIY
jgi:hypothetical protein